MAEYPRVQFRAGELLDALLTRGGDLTREATLAQVAQRDLARYYALLQRALPAFMEPEASLIVDALNGTLLESHTAHLLWAEVADAVHGDHLDEKWDCDGEALVARLRALTPFEALSVADAAERFWVLAPQGLPIGEALRRVGLVRDAATG